MNVVLDTNVLIPITLWNYSLAQKVLIRLLKSNAKIFTSLDILKEYNKALTRDFEISQEEVNRFIQKISLFLNIVEVVEKIDIVKEDPDDNKIIECAIASNSEYIITYDNHLLKLKEFKGINIIKPEEFLKIIS